MNDQWKLSDIVGQKQVINSLLLCTKTAVKSNKPLPHTLFQGPPGLGKSTIAYAMANEVGRKTIELNGATITSPKALVKSLMQLEDRDILFIDEIHALPTKVCELLYMPLQDRKLLLSKQGKEDNAVTLPLRDFTCIGATTNIGLVPKPFVDRMSLKFYLEYYSDEEIEIIIRDHAPKIDLKLTPSGITNLAKRCKNTPRIAKSHMEWLRNYSVAQNIVKIDGKIVDSACDMYGLDEFGLDANDRLYLKTLEDSHGPMGLKTISSICNIPENAIVEHIEPYLIRIGKIVKTKSGRDLAERYNQSDLDRILSMFGD